MAKNDSDKKRIYFDWAASAPILKSLPASNSLFGNPSSLHSEGRIAKQALEDARKRCAHLLNVPPQNLYFTSGGTESNSIALFSTLTRPAGRIISSLAEHASIREGMETLEKMGKPCGRISVDSAGMVTPELFSKALSQYPDTRFAALMSVNNETGAINDILSLTSRAGGNKAPVHFHCDLVQAIGKIPVDFQKWNFDSASISAHKIGGLRGIGLLYLKKPLEVFYSGGGQENGIRGGSENVTGAVSLADSLEAVRNKQINENAEQSARRRWNRLITALKANKRCTVIPEDRSADDERFSPYILQTAFNNIPGEVMARALDDLGFAVSTGSACSSSSPERPVLAAMGVEEKLRIEGIRISQGYATSDEEIELLLEAIAEILNFL